MTVNEIVDTLKNKYKIDDVEYAIVCGSGLADALPNLEDKVEVPYACLGLPTSKVKGHSGNFVFGKFNNKKVVLVSRIHYYESGKLENVRLPFEIIAKLGVKKVVLLTSSGGLNKTYKVGDLVLIKDHINFAGINPLIGVEDMQFTNMCNCYNSEWRPLALSVAKGESVGLKEGVFVQMSGPSYETCAEVEMLRLLGADTVSMSTAFDCIICNYLKMTVIGFSVVVNVFSGDDVNLNHQEVLDNAKQASINLKKILCKII